MHADGRPSGMAFVEFDCPQEAMRALVCLLYTTPCSFCLCSYCVPCDLLTCPMHACHTKPCRTNADGIVHTCLPLQKMSALLAKPQACVQACCLTHLYVTAISSVMYHCVELQQTCKHHFCKLQTACSELSAACCPADLSCVLQSKDREQFGVAYGERFCLLQLVGRAELAKASTRRATPMNIANGYNMQVSYLPLTLHATSVMCLLHSCLSWCSYLLAPTMPLLTCTLSGSFLETKLDVSSLAS